MNIEGSCYCGKVSFSALSHTPYPYMRCYCSICRKTSGSGGYGINIMAQADSLIVQGQDNLAFHHGMQHDPVTDNLIPSDGKRFFLSSVWQSLMGGRPTLAGVDLSLRICHRHVITSTTRNRPYYARFRRALGGNTIR